MYYHKQQALQFKLSCGNIQTIMNCDINTALNLLKFNANLERYFLRRTGKIHNFIKNPEQKILYRIVFERTLKNLGNDFQHVLEDFEKELTPKLQFGVKKYADFMGISEKDATEIVCISTDVQDFLNENIIEENGLFSFSIVAEKRILRRRDEMIYKIQKINSDTLART